jgi:hypothetical protein
MEDTSNGGWGVIGRDCIPDICVAAAGPLQFIKDAMHAETMALSNVIDILTEWAWAGLFSKRLPQPEARNVNIRLLFLRSWCVN